MKKCVALLLTLVLLLSIAGCSGDDSTVRIACFPNVTHTQALLGRIDETFEARFGEETQVEWYTFNAGPSEVEALFAGNIDIGYIGPIPAINAYVRSRADVSIIAGVTNGGSVLVTRPDLTLEDVSDLDGLVVSVPQYNNTQDIILRALLSEAGLAPKSEGGTVDIVASENSNTKLLLDTGEIDAAIVPEPWGSRLIDEVGANILLDYDEIYDGNYTVAVVIVSNDFLKDNREVVKDFLREHVALTLQANEQLEQSAERANQCIEQLTGSSLADEVVQQAYSRMTITYDPEKESLEQFIDICTELGTISEEVNVDELVDLSLLNEVLEEMGLSTIE